MNTVIVSGRLVREPEVRYSNDSMAVTRFTLAIDRKLSKEKREQAEANNQPTADFMPIVTFYKTAELCGNYLEKGARVLVKGRLQTGSYINKDNQRVYTTDVVADEVEFIDYKARDEQGKVNNQNDSEQGEFVPFTDDGKIPF